MDPLPSGGHLVATPGTSIQTAANLILDIITAERKDAAQAAQQRYLQLEQNYANLKENASAAVGVEQARLSDTTEKLINAQTLLTQYQHMYAYDYDPQLASVTRPFPHPGRIEYAPSKQVHEVELHRVARQEANSVKQQLEELQNVLRDVGIIFCSKDNSLRFEAGWAAVLAQLEARDFGSMNAGRLHEVLGQLTHRLQNDRETIGQLEKQIQTLQAEKAQIVQKYELELQVSQLEASLLQNAVEAHRRPKPSPITTTSGPRLAPVSSTTTVSDAPGIATHVLPGDLIVRPSTGKPFIDCTRRRLV
ncbi:hypothetical protein H0H87_002875 [Tephrocybe sp. NHM501043]|nr:hypothetical protein H0H87_002875 [Tephrocybe sp. NHM501043]